MPHSMVCWVCSVRAGNCGAAGELLRSTWLQQRALGCRLRDAFDVGKLPGCWSYMWNPAQPQDGDPGD